MHEYVKLLCETAERYADNTAIVDHEGTRETDYKTLWEMTQRTASWVLSKDPKPGSYIPVRFESSAEFVAAVCGVWLSGNAAVPMGASFP
ncbi:MAG: AMP-binding protein, partial [Oscillospiraceae bacterium]|nr:AMP-binding protein [Oscillospiraceae bacterium]